MGDGMPYVLVMSQVSTDGGVSMLLQGSQNKSYGHSMRFTSRSQTAQSVLSINHSSLHAPPPSTISQHVNGDSLTVTTPSVEESSIT